MTEICRCKLSVLNIFTEMLTWFLCTYYYVFFPPASPRPMMDNLPSSFPQVIWHKWWRYAATRKCFNIKAPATAV